MSNVDHLIQVINKLQDCFSSLGKSCPIDLPQIAVVGEQSAGKSSVLENFVGKDFLPRGSGIVTRRPLVLQMINQKGEEYAQFLHTGDKRFTNFLDVRREIEEETDRVAGSDKNISSIPINLRVYSPNVLNLTLIDLPGITKVPIHSQPKDIEFQIKEMISNFIRSEKCLILAVVPAVIDLANSEALKIAKEFDPKGTRTIGVITKIDMMDQGTNCKDTLENKVYHLARGYVGIVNRSQRDIEGNKDIHTAQKSEMEYFKNHEIYRNMLDRMGSQFLQKTLNQQLTQHIRESLPSLRHQILEEIKELENTLGPYLYKSETDDTERTKIFMTLIQEFAKYIDVVLGYQQEFVETQELSGGSNINKMLYQRFPYELSKIRPDPAKMRKEIAMGIKNSHGVKGLIFTPDIAFISVAKRRIEETRSSCCRIPELVGSEILKIAEKACSEKLSTYPALMAEVMSICQEHLSEMISVSKKYINFYMDAEYSHINTKHPDFSVFDSSGSENGKKRPDRGHENNIYRKGYLTISGQSFLKSARTEYFVLKGSLLTSYKDERMIDQKFQIVLEGVHIKNPDGGRKNSFILYHHGGKMLGKDLKTLELTCQNAEEAEGWKAAFDASGVPTDVKSELGGGGSQTSESDPNLAKNVEYIYALVSSYLKIVNKNQIRKKIPTDTVARLVGANMINKLMAEREDLVEERSKLQRTYKACREAIDHIQSIMSSMGLDSSSSSRLPTMYKSMKTGNWDNSSNFESLNSSSSTTSFPKTQPLKPKRPPNV